MATQAAPRQTIGDTMSKGYPMARDYGSYEGWKAEVLKRNVTHWRQVDDWFFPTPENAYYKGDNRAAPKYYHMCEENWKIYVTAIKTGNHVKACDEGCLGCGEVIPDGIKMIMALLSW